MSSIDLETGKLSEGDEEHVLESVQALARVEMAHDRYDSAMRFAFGGHLEEK